MKISLESSSDRNHLEFRAPPPSPVASGRRSTFTNDDVLTEFLENSLRVPDLILPDRVFPLQKPIKSPPVIDFQSLNSPGSDSVDTIMESIARIGCFQLVNYAIDQELIRSAYAAGAGIFRLPADKKAAMMRSPEKRYGFEEFRGEENGEKEMSEEFVWCRETKLKSEMEGIWPQGYSNFSEKIEMLWLEIEAICERVLSVLKEHIVKSKTMQCQEQHEDDVGVGAMCCVYKHCGDVDEDELMSSLKYDVIRMLIRGTETSYAFCVHLCDGSSEFHVYNKKGWVSFHPHRDALIITIGDQVQAWSDGLYKHVIGRPIFKRGEEEGGDSTISMAFLFSPQKLQTQEEDEMIIITLPQQAITFLLLTLVYQFLAYINNRW